MPFLGARPLPAHAAHPWGQERAASAGKDVCGVRRWALDVQGRTNHNKAACALANKLARICYATLRDKEPFADNERVNIKINRESFVMPA